MPKLSEYLNRAKQQNDSLNAFRYFPESYAEQLNGPLNDLTVAVKDNILVKDWPAGASSKILEGFVSPYDATVIRRLKAAGAAFIGRTNMDEFAMGSSTENSAYGVTKNPWDHDKVPGGSSGGSAAAVAADLCDVALGSDTGGSIRQPAAFCGITGLKPTYGTVSRYGLIALASSLDQIGPMARSAETVERVMEVISGRDEFDQTTIDYRYEPADVSIKGLRVGLPKELWQLDIDPVVKRSAQEFVDWLAAKGAFVTDVSLPYLPYGLPAYYVIMPAEASSNLTRFDGIRYKYSAETNDLMKKYLESRQQFGKEAKRRILLGTYVLSVGHFDSYYQTAVKIKQLIAEDYERVFKSVDILVSPTTPSLPFSIGERTEDPVKMYQADLLTVAVNLAGVPGLSIPTGFAGQLPIGTQLVGPRMKDNVLLSVAKQFQTETDYHLKTAGGENG